MTGKKSASISKVADALTRNVDELTSVSRVTVPSLPTVAPVTIKAKPILSADEWVKAGLCSNSDKNFVNRIISGSRFGVSVEYKGPLVTREPDNWKSAYELRDVVIASLNKDIMLGRKAGPFKQPPFDNFVVSPMGAFKRKRSLNKYRVIHDLSWPPGHSINDFISEEDSSVEYVSVAQIADVVRKLGNGMYMAKLDIADAYKEPRTGIYLASAGPPSLVRSFITLIKLYLSALDLQRKYLRNSPKHCVTS